MSVTIYLNERRLVGCELTYSYGARQSVDFRHNPPKFVNFEPFQDYGCETIKIPEHDELHDSLFNLFRQYLYLDSWKGFAADLVKILNLPKKTLEKNNVISTWYDTKYDDNSYPLPYLEAIDKLGATLSPYPKEKHPDITHLNDWQRYHYPMNYGMALELANGDFLGRFKKEGLKLPTQLISFSQEGIKSESEFKVLIKFRYFGLRGDGVILGKYPVAKTDGGQLAWRSDPTFFAGDAKEHSLREMKVNEVFPYLINRYGVALPIFPRINAILSHIKSNDSVTIFDLLRLDVKYWQAGEDRILWCVAYLEQRGLIAVHSENYTILPTEPIDELKEQDSEQF